MVSLQELINQISPYDASNNPTGSKFVAYPPEILAQKANQPSRRAYRVIVTTDGGETYREERVELLGSGVGTASEAWVFTVTPTFFDRKETLFLKTAEDQIKSWWQATGKNLYLSRGSAAIYNYDLNLATVRCLAITKDANQAVQTAKIDTWIFNRNATVWSYWLLGTEILKS